MATPNLRRPVVAGQFYPAEAAALRRELGRYVTPGGARESWFGGIAPHAGYIYSGATAGALFSRLAVPATAVLLGPKHTGEGAPYAVWPAGAWRTPLGDAPVDEELAAALVDASPLLRADELAHRSEHSLEVVLPFLQYVRPDVAVVPVSLAPLAVSEIDALAGAMAGVLAPRGRDVIVVVSSDMTHYESAAAAERKDRLALDRVAALDGPGLVEVARAYGVTMCGVWPAAVALGLVRALGASRGVVLHYTNSGEASGDYDQVVGYAAVAFA